MKCKTCGGLIVEDQWNPGKRKCVNCGRDPETDSSQQSAVSSQQKQVASAFTADEKGDDGMEVKRDKDGKVIIPEGYIYQPEHKRKNGTVRKECLRKYGYKKKSRGEKVPAKPSKGGRNYKAEYTRRKNKDAVGNTDLRSSRDLFPHALKSRKSSDPITTATPEEIIKALRKGVAQEIIQAIQERFV